MSRSTARQRLRQSVKDGRDKARPQPGGGHGLFPAPAALGHQRVGGQRPCRWRTRPSPIRRWGVALGVGVHYRGCAIPVAWFIVPAQEAGAWMPPILALIAHLHPAIPSDWRTLVRVDRGLWSPTRWHHLQQRWLAPWVALPRTVRCGLPSGSAGCPRRCWSRRRVPG